MAKVPARLLPHVATQEDNIPEAKEQDYLSNEVDLFHVRKQSAPYPELSSP